MLGYVVGNCIVMVRGRIMIVNSRSSSAASGVDLMFLVSQMSGIQVDAFGVRWFVEEKDCVV